MSKMSRRNFFFLLRHCDRLGLGPAHLQKKIVLCDLVFFLWGPKVGLNPQPSPLQFSIFLEPKARSEWCVLSSVSEAFPQQSLFWIGGANFCKGVRSKSQQVSPSHRVPFPQLISELYVIHAIGMAWDLPLWLKFCTADAPWVLQPYGKITTSLSKKVEIQIHHLHAN